ncbi:MAG: CHAP domain-containing protein [Nocardioides sp.]|uniref:CHAP domain-containing protein n=1 Tax=Nocardioides sp. TaxID=35761 RepID=UPI0039E3C6D8
MPHQSHASHKTARVLASGAVLLLVALTFQVLVPKLTPRADAASSFLCVGFSDCSAKGYSASGYHKNWGHMYWQMYSGRNCVNYAAYRMVKAGMPNSRPWSGSGNATNWGKAMASITDKTPAVGAIAWWKANAPGAGSLGHVAYVEKVVSSSEIIISESNYGNDFDWRRVTTASSWPTGFIHFRDRTLSNTKKPVVAGTAAVGSTLTVGTGRWSPSATSFSYQWWADGKPISGATARTFTVPASLVGDKIGAKVTVSRSGYTATTVTSHIVGPAVKGTLGVSKQPTITGTAQVGRTLRVGGAVYTPGARAGAIRWYADGKFIAGARKRTFTLTSAQLGKTITAKVGGVRAGYTKRVTTATGVGPVTTPQVTTSATGSVGGTTSYGRTLTVKPGSFSPSSAKVRYQWKRDGKAISGATRASYTSTKADVGHVLTVTLTATASGYRSYQHTYAPGRVKATPTVTVHATGLRGAERITIRVSSAGGYAPSGKVEVMTHSVIRHVKLTHGKAKITYRHVPAGTRKVKVTFPGNTGLRSAVGWDQTTVKKKEKKK